jgi:RHS repeat-associated protein
MCACGKTWRMARMAGSDITASPSQLVARPSLNRILTYCYDDVGRVASLTGKVGPSGTATPYASLPEPVNGGSAYSYAPHGAVQQMTLGNGITESHSWNNRLQQTSVSAGSLLGLSFYPCDNGQTICTNNNGNIWRETISVNGTLQATQEYRYDALNRLTLAGERTGATGFTPTCLDGNGNSVWCEQDIYDAVGNRTVNPGSVSGLTWRVAGISRPANRVSDAGWSYDLAGNITATPTTTSIAYDAENRQVTFCPSGISCEQYVYDGNGQRVQKYDSSSPSTTTVTYAYDASGQLATESGGTSAASGTQYLTADHLGSTRLVTDAMGVATERHDYQPFGYEVSGGWRTAVMAYAPETVRQQFTGKERDAETGLDYFGARYMSSAQGRFTSADPLLGSARVIDPQTWNRYAYGLNNPLRNSDPTGLFDWDGSAGSNLSDDELAARAADKDGSKKERKWAKNALSFRQKFRAALGAADEAASKSGQGTAQEAVAAYGEEGEHNNVFVGVNPDAPGSAATTTPFTLDGSAAQVVSFNTSLGGDGLAVTAAHEGRHVGDYQAWLDAGRPAGGALDLNHYAQEQRAWYVSSYISEALGMKSYRPPGGGSEMQVWNAGWARADAATVESHRSAGVQSVLGYMASRNPDFGANSKSDTYSAEQK